MAQLHIQRGSGSQKDKEDPFVDDGGWRPGGSAASARAAGSNAQGTLDDIDKMLADNEAGAASPSDTNSGDSKYGNSGGKYGNSGGSKYASRDDLKEKENNAGDDLNYSSGAGKKKSNKKKFKVDKNKARNVRRAGIFSALGGTLVGGGLFGASILSVPSQALQIGAFLHKPAALGEDQASQVKNSLYNRVRAIKGRPFTRTVMSKLGDKVFGHPVDRLRAIGITSEPGITAQVVKMNINTDLLESRFPEMKGMDTAAKKDFLAEKLNIGPDSISGSGSKLFIDQTNMSVRQAKLLNTSTLPFLENGKIINTINTHRLLKTLDLPSPWHPLKYASATAERLAESQLNGTKSQKNAASEQLEEKALDADTAKPIAEGQGAVDSVKITDELYGTAGKLLTFTSGVCEVRSVADKIPIINRLRVAIPAAIAAGRLIGLAEQIKSGGKDVTVKQIGVIMRSLKDAQGKGILNNNAPMEELARNSHTKYAPDIPGDEQQAFSTRTTASNIRAGASKIVGGESVASALCSTVGQAVQAIASIAIAVADAVGEIGSAGTLTPAIMLQVGAKVGVQVLVSAVTLHYIEKFVLSQTTQGKLSASLLKGPVGGAILAYGARELANITATSGGGVDLGNETSTALLDQELQKEQQQFQSENFFARMFDAYDNRSLLGHYMADISPSFADNLINLSGSLLHVGSAFSSIFGGLLPKAAAAPEEVTDYDWTFGQSGIPPQLLSDPNLQDPYTNGDLVADALDASCLSNGEVDDSCDLVTRINSCFGNTVSYDNGTWDVVATDDADPHSETYLNAHCDDTGSNADTANNTPTGLWRRVIMFVNATHDMKSAACFEGDAQSCADEGLSAGIDATDNPTSDPSTASTTSAYNFSIPPKTAAARLAAIGITP